MEAGKLLKYLNYRMRAFVKMEGSLFLSASYFFYGYWDGRFCFLLLFVTAVSYFTAKANHNQWAFAIGIVVPFAVLGVFKYFNFFLLSAAAVMGRDIGALKIILPVGISLGNASSGGGLLLNANLFRFFRLFGYGDRIRQMPRI